jgi:hypothetical protein
MKLSHIALAPTFFINIIALLRATNNNIHFNSGRNLLYHLATSETVYYAKRLGGYWTLMHREPTPTNSLDSTTKLIFSTFKRYQPISAPDTPTSAPVATTATLPNTTSTTSPESSNTVQPSASVKKTTCRRYKEQFKSGNELHKHLRESCRYTQQQRET